MKKIITLVFVAITLMGINGYGYSEDIPDKMVQFSYLTPYQYELINGSYKVAAIVSKEGLGENTEITFEGEKLQIKNHNKDNFLVQLPLTGNPGFLKISQKQNKNELVHEQYFEPLIPADWDYFGEGEIHIIVSSHQDIAWMNTPDSCRHERVFDIVLPALDLIEKEPDFKFGMEQSLNLMEALEDSPDVLYRCLKFLKNRESTTCLFRV